MRHIYGIHFHFWILRLRIFIFMVKEMGLLYRPDTKWIWIWKLKVCCARERLCETAPRHAGVITHPPLLGGRGDRYPGDTAFHWVLKERRAPQGPLVIRLRRTVGIWGFTPTTLLVELKDDKHALMPNPYSRVRQRSLRLRFQYSDGRDYCRALTGLRGQCTDIPQIKMWPVSDMVVCACVLLRIL